jgi:hypothetical protein
MKKEKGKTFLWRMQEQCNNCPFATEGLGLQLRRSLGKGRWKEIVASVMRGDRFPCHKTTQATGNGTELFCAGALDFQHAHGVISVHENLCKVFEGCHENKKEIFRRLKSIAKKGGLP